jgi:hypothetical protein
LDAPWETARLNGGLEALVSAACVTQLDGGCDLYVDVKTTKILKQVRRDLIAVQVVTSSYSWLD